MRDEPAGGLRHSAKNGRGQYAAFEAALKKVISVPHSEIKAKLDAEKRKRTKRASASHAATSQR